VIFLFNPQRYALDAAKEITIATVSGTNQSSRETSAENVALLYETIYKKVLELASSVNAD
jgi:hypothetical protein